MLVGHPVEQYIRLVYNDLRAQHEHGASSLAASIEHFMNSLRADAPIAKAKRQQVREENLLPLLISGPLHTYADYEEYHKDLLEILADSKRRAGLNDQADLLEQQLLAPLPAVTKKFYKKCLEGPRALAIGGPPSSERFEASSLRANYSVLQYDIHIS